MNCYKQTKMLAFSEESDYFSDTFHTCTIWCFLNDV